MLWCGLRFVGILVRVRVLQPGSDESAKDFAALLGPVLRYVLMQVELQMRTDSPMLLVLDDAAIPWAVSRIEEKSKEWMMTTRKKSVSLVFMTHSLSQVFDSALGPLLEEGCPTRFYLPMPAAKEPRYGTPTRCLHERHRVGSAGPSAIFLASDTPGSPQCGHVRSFTKPPEPRWSSP